MRVDGWQVFSGKHKTLVTECAELMADTLIGVHDCQMKNFFAAPLFSDTEDLAYLQGCLAIKSLRLGPVGTRQLIRQFKEALSIRELSGADVNTQVAKFRVYYWTMMVCSTNCAERRFARKKVERYRQLVDQQAF